MTRQELKELQGDRTLLDIALFLHMNNTGASDTIFDMGKEEGVRQLDEARLILRVALETWEPQVYRPFVRFDNCVKELIEAVLAEDNYHKETSSSSPC